MTQQTHTHSVMDSSKRALISGCTGQDGSILAEFLLNKGYIVYGLVRRVSTPNYINIKHILDRLNIIEGDLADSASIDRAITIAQPDEVYNLGAMTFVGHSFNAKQVTLDITGQGAVRVFESVRRYAPKAKVYQASSSEMFGKNDGGLQNEKTQFYPRSPYGCAKVLAHQAAINFREAYGLQISCGISFNHESPRRGTEFLSRKVTHAVARIKCGLQKDLRLGNLDTARDFGYAPEYVQGMWLMHQNDPDDYIMATGEARTIKEWVEEAFRCVGLDPWKYVKQDKRFMRPSDVPYLCGDPSKIHRQLGWKARTRFSDLVKLMVEADLERLKT